MMMNASSILDSSPSKVDNLMKNVVPPFAAAPKFGGPVYQSASKDYGNFVDSKRIDEIISNVRQLRQHQNTYAL
jgi:hypothetical protein